MKIPFKSSEVLVLLAASAMSLLANLPDDILDSIVDKKMLLSALTALVVVAMFRYLQMFLLLVISILAIGANLPTELASGLGISQLALMVSLGVLISIALLNRVINLLPMESEGSSSNYEGAREDKREAMLAAIAKGDQVSLHRMLVMNADVNFILDGTTPLHLAAEKGYPDIVQLLIKYGADFRKKNSQGVTALEIALAKKKFIKTTELLHSASKSRAADFGQNEARRGEDAIWQSHY